MDTRDKRLYRKKFKLLFNTAIAGVIGGTALSAPEARRTSGVTSYPVTADFTRPSDWQDGDITVAQWSADPTFATGVTESAPVTLAAATTTASYGLSAIAGTKYIRFAAWRGSRPTLLNWSNVIGVGDAVAPTITSSAAPSGYQSVVGSLTLTADKAATWAIVGGFDMAQFSIVGNVLSWTAQAAISSLSVQVQATSYFNVPSTVQAITLGILANTANAFSFTDVTGASLSTQYTSNTITVAGIGVPPVPVSVVGGTYSKNGGAFTSAAGTATNGDTFAVRQTSAAGNNTTTDVILTIGSTSDTYSVSTPIVLSTNTAWSTTDKSGVTLTNSNKTAQGNVAFGSFQGVRGDTSKSTSKRYLEGTHGAGPNSPGDNTSFGIANASATLNAEMSGNINAVMYFASGVIRFNGSSPYTPASLAAGDIVGICIDITNSLIWFSKNGTWLFGDPSAGTGGLSIAGIGTTLFPAYNDTYRGIFTLNCGQTAFTYPMPTGAVAWDL